MLSIKPNKQLSTTPDPGHHMGIKEGVEFIEDITKALDQGDDVDVIYIDVIKHDS